jgi:hypothetical protein
MKEYLVWDTNKGDWEMKPVISRKRISIFALTLVAITIVFATAATNNENNENIEEQVAIMNQGVYTESFTILKEVKDLVDVLGNDAVLPNVYGICESIMQEGFSETEALEIAEETIIEKEALYQYAVEQGFGISDEEFNIMMDDEIQMFISAVEYPSIQAICQEIGVEFEDAIRANSIEYMRNWVTGRYYGFLQDNYMNDSGGNDSDGNIVVDDSEIVVDDSEGDFFPLEGGLDGSADDIAVSDDEFFAFEDDSESYDSEGEFFASDGDVFEFDREAWNQVWDAKTAGITQEFKTTETAAELANVLENVVQILTEHEDILDYARANPAECSARYGHFELTEEPDEPNGPNEPNEPNDELPDAFIAAMAAFELGKTIGHDAVLTGVYRIEKEKESTGFAKGQAIDEAQTELIEREAVYRQAIQNGFGISDAALESRLLEEIARLASSGEYSAILAACERDGINFSELIRADKVAYQRNWTIDAYRYSVHKDYATTYIDGAMRGEEGWEDYWTGHCAEIAAAFQSTKAGYALLEELYASCKLLNYVEGDIVEHASNSWNKWLTFDDLAG